MEEQQQRLAYCQRLYKAAALYALVTAGPGAMLLAVGTTCGAACPPVLHAAGAGLVLFGLGSALFLLLCGLLAA